VIHPKRLDSRLPGKRGNSWPVEELTGERVLEHHNGSTLQQAHCDAQGASNYTVGLRHFRHELRTMRVVIRTPGCAGHRVKGKSRRREREVVNVTRRVQVALVPLSHVLAKVVRRIEPQIELLARASGGFPDPGQHRPGLVLGLDSAEHLAKAAARQRLSKETRGKLVAGRSKHFMTTATVDLGAVRKSSHILVIMAKLIGGAKSVSGGAPDGFP